MLPQGATTIGALKAKGKVTEIIIGMGSEPTRWVIVQSLDTGVTVMELYRPGGVSNIPRTFADTTEVFVQNNPAWKSENKMRWNEIARMYSSITPMP